MAAGFEGVEITWRKDIFEGAPRPSEEAKAFGTRGVNLRAYKPGA